MFKCPGCSREFKADFKFPFRCMCGVKSYGDGVNVSEKVVHRSRGLGDTIAKFTKAIGIKPCRSCEQRQAALNALVPYSS